MNLLNPATKYVDIAILVVVLGLLAVLGVQTVRLSGAKADLAQVKEQHATLVAAAARMSLEASERYRALEKEHDAAVADLSVKAKEAEDERNQATARADAVSGKLRDAKSQYLAEQARRAAANPAAACRIDGETKSLLVELHGETDDFAGLASSEADKYAGKLALLQDYVREVCVSAAK